MKRIMILVAVFSVGTVMGATVLQQEPDLNALLDERIALNKRYKVENTEAAKEFKYAKQLQSYEAGVSDSWVTLIQYAKASPDPKLKKIVLQLEYFDELRNYTYDLEYADSEEKVALAQKHLKFFYNKMQQIAVKQ